MSAPWNSPRLIVALFLVLLAACDVGSAPTTPGERSASPEATDAVLADLAGEWFCYSYQPSVGTNSVNVAGIAGANSLLGSFVIEEGGRYVAFYDADPGAFEVDSGGSIRFESGGMVGLEGTIGAGPNQDLIDLHGVSDGWDEPSVVYLICERD